MTRGQLISIMWQSKKINKSSPKEGNKHPNPLDVDSRHTTYWKTFTYKIPELQIRIQHRSVMLMFVATYPNQAIFIKRSFCCCQRQLIDWEVFTYRQTGELTAMVSWVCNLSSSVACMFTHRHTHTHLTLKFINNYFSVDATVTPPKVQEQLEATIMSLWKMFFPEWLTEACGIIA